MSLRTLTSSVPLLDQVSGAAAVTVDEAPAKVDTATCSGDAGVMLDKSVATVALGGVEGAPLELGAICQGFRSALAELLSSEKLVEAATLTRGKVESAPAEREWQASPKAVNSPGSSLAR